MLPVEDAFDIIYGADDHDDRVQFWTLLKEAPLEPLKLLLKVESPEAQELADEIFELDVKVKATLWRAFRLAY